VAGLGGLGARRGRRRLNAEVNIINLVDVVLVLLIIFMVTAPMMQGGIEVRLPKAASRPITATNALTVTVDKGGRISLDDQQLSYDQFRVAFTLLVARKHPEVVYVRGDQAARYGEIARVLGIVNAAGIRSVGLVTEPTAAP
jgi:biopolymer transport protein ExbD/biopolymer transport protein TolR